MRDALSVIPLSIMCFSIYVLQQKVTASLQLHSFFFSFGKTKVLELEGERSKEQIYAAPLGEDNRTQKPRLSV